ncbi:hypothetical protein OG792_13775 [Micromonospora sp. NBC_01699]|uniref:hypothetical protein n=1 Tax=Micromonospora sp. NBC_01699 TaxID=2975984 RepID=UPI002E32A781|nr:hypothetical protein [Micromonospora sp. NBC_01699]
MNTPPTPSSGPAWIQILLSAVGLLGCVGGVFAVASVTVRRHRFSTDTAQLLTDTALTIVRPLRGRVAELETETAQTRGQALAAEREISELRVTHRELTALRHRWREAILAPDATVAAIRAHARPNRAVRGDESPTTDSEV